MALLCSHASLSSLGPTLTPSLIPPSLILSSPFPSPFPSLHESVAFIRGVSCKFTSLTTGVCTVKALVKLSARPEIWPRGLCSVDMNILVQRLIANGEIERVHRTHGGSMEIKIDSNFSPFFLLANTKIEVRELPFYIQVRLQSGIRFAREMQVVSRCAPRIQFGSYGTLQCTLTYSMDLRASTCSCAVGGPTHGSVG